MHHIAAPSLTQPLAPLVPGVCLGNYWLEGHLGGGGFGQVYRARDLRGQIVALKVIPSEEEGSREAQVLRAAVHPSIPQLKDTFPSPYGFCLVQEYVWGETVESRQIRMGGRLPIAEVLLIGRQVATSLAALHRHVPPVLHLDIKPGNLILRQDGWVMVVDFGIAMFDAAGWPVTGGAPAYMPPEQHVRRAEPRSDVYALGASMWDLLAGLPPEPLHQRFPPLPSKCPRRLRHLLQQMLRLRADQRPTAANVAEDLGALASSGRGSQR